MNLTTRFQLSRWRLEDTARHSRLLRSLNAIRLVLTASVVRDDVRAAGILSRALGFSEASWLNEATIKALKRRFPPEGNSDLWRKVVAQLPRYRKLLENEPSLTRSIILKAPHSDGEKGVLLMFFEYNWARLVCGLSDTEFDWLDSHYDFILSTSWSPTDFAMLSLFLAKTSGPVFVQPCNFGDKSKLSAFHPRIVVLDSMPSDWINPRLYTNGKKERSIDFLMVANWGEFKRHWDFFLALRRMPKSLRVVLVGQREGERDAEFIRKLARQLEVPQHLEIHQSIPIEAVNRLQEDSKVSLIFSRREGCCVAAVESLFAGCALGMRIDAYVGTLEYITPETGLRLRPGHLSEDLNKLLTLSDSLDPAAWARSRLSCDITQEKVNRVLFQSSRTRGLPWTRDIAVPYWFPYPRHLHEKDAESLRPAYAELHQRFPKVVAIDLIERGHH